MLESYLYTVMEFENMDYLTYVLKENSVLYNTFYEIRFEKNYNNTCSLCTSRDDSENSMLLGVIHQKYSADDLLNDEWRYFLTTGGIRLYQMGDYYVIEGDPTLFISRNIYSTSGEPSFGCSIR